MADIKGLLREKTFLQTVLQTTVLYNIAGSGTMAAPPNNFFKNDSLSRPIKTKVGTLKPKWLPLSMLNNRSKLDLRKMKNDKVWQLSQRQS
jgi:hypothetical protein